MIDSVVHSITLTNRDKLDICGAMSVLVFDSDYILIELEKDKLSVEGSDLKLINLIQDKKQVQVSGKINGIFYQDGASKKSGFFKKK